MLGTELQDTSDPLATGLFGGTWAEAWNEGDLETFWSFYAPGARFVGMALGSDELDAYVAFLQAIDFHLVRSNCVFSNPAFATCTSAFTDDLYEPVGWHYRSNESFWFDESGLITVYQPRLTGPMGSDAYDAALAEWFAEHHPRLAAGFFGPDIDDPAPDIAAEVAALIPAFLAQSDAYPPGKAVQLPEPRLTASVGEVDVYNGTEQQHQLIEWALGRFRSAGLTAPIITHVTFPPTEACERGVSGMAFHDGASGHVDICFPGDEFSSSGELPLVARWTTLHELAHIWTVDQLEASSRQAFLEHRALDVWNGAPDWQDNGTEQAAEVLAWALLDEPMRVSVGEFPTMPRIPDATCETLADAYRILTGAAPAQRLSDCTDPN